ncbi:toll/interleukin-1 receptor domain-containing protein [Gimesia chilikensis]|uniref:toll/interleukin-1 receptor domain-containing protein n=1 Tax=Gimesia chilikensis TaxID=2605989 RepID=UPI003A92A237
MSKSSTCDYQHHIFLSYRRSDENWIKWTKVNFCNALESLLRIRLGPISIFIDESIETNSSWPANLALNLARSRLFIPVLSRDYFYSEWCKLEMGLMCAREKAANLRSAQNPYGLIIPVVIDDGETFPKEIQEMQSLFLHDFANPYIRTDSTKQEELAELLKSEICPTIESALKIVPPYDPAWESYAQKHFEHKFDVVMQSQTKLPSIELPKLP